MKLLRLTIPVLALPLFFLASCVKDTSKPALPVNDYNYFPLQVGKFVEYDVDSTYWNDFLALKTVHTLQMRYTVMDTSTDEQGRLSYRIEVMKRKNENMLWEPGHVFTVTQTTNQLEWSERDFRFVKLVYPVEKGRTWEGNQYVSVYDQVNRYFQGWNYEYTDVHSSYNTGSKTYEDVLTVSQVDETVNSPELQPEAYASRTYGVERYAQGVGMIQKEFTYWIYDPGVRKARKGYSVVMRAFNNN